MYFLQFIILLYTLVLVKQYSEFLKTIRCRYFINKYTSVLFSKFYFTVSCILLTCLYCQLLQSLKFIVTRLFCITNNFFFKYDVFRCFYFYFYYDIPRFMFVFQKIMTNHVLCFDFNPSYKFFLIFSLNTLSFFFCTVQLIHFIQFV